VALENLRFGCSYCVVFGQLESSRIVQLNKVVEELISFRVLKQIVEESDIEMEDVSSMNKNIQSMTPEYKENENMEILATHMDKCHTQLDVIGVQLTRKLKQEYSVRANRFIEEREKLEERMMKLQQVLDTADKEMEHLNEPNFKISDVSNVEEFVKEMSEDNNIEVLIDDSIFGAISSHIAMSKCKTDIALGMKPKIERLDTIWEEEAVDLMGDDKRHLGDEDNVVLLHVESPDSFFLMKTSDWKLADYLRMNIEKQWKEGEKGNIQVDHKAGLKIGDEYHRVEVVTIESDLAWVYFLDKGCYSQTPLTSLVRLPKNLSSLPGLALHCRLAGIISELEWGENAGRGVEQFCGRDVCRAVVRDEEENLTIVSITKMIDGAVVSLLEFLAFHGLVEKEGGDEYEISKTSPVRSFYLLTLEMKKSHLVKVVHVTSPGKIAMNVIGEYQSYQTYMDSMMMAMQEYYMEKTDEHLVLLPYIGMVCATKHRENEDFYRAEVLELIPALCMVKVVLVDIGIEQVVHLNMLRRLPDKFLILPAMGICVGLAGIKSVGETWNEDANIYVKKKLLGKRMRILVHEVNLGETRVFMYPETSDETSVNKMIVDDGYAIEVASVFPGEEPEVVVVSDSIDAYSEIPLPEIPDMYPGSEMVCRVVGCTSPDDVSMRNCEDEESFYELRAKMNNSKVKYFSVDRKWSTGDKCAVKTPRDGWVRARVDSFMEKDMVELLLIDYGSKFVTSVSALMHLPSNFCSTWPYSWKVQIPHLKPAGGGEAWTDSACEALLEVLERTGMQVDIMIGDRVNEDMWQAEVFVRKKKDEAGPLDPEEFNYVKVGGVLVELGLAIPTYSSSMEFCHKYGKKGSKLCSEKNLSTVNSDIMNGRIDASEADFRWLDPLPPHSAFFEGKVSHVDWDCTLYMSSMQDNMDNLSIIGSLLENKYAGSMYSSTDLKWCVGEACIAQFSQDKKWYRGKVLQVIGWECLVKFVDYGNDELCKFENLRKGLFLTEIPVQCFPAKLSIDPIGCQWEEGVLDFIHNTIVDKMMMVTVIENKMVLPLEVKIVTMAGLDIKDLLVNNGYANNKKTVI